MMFDEETMNLLGKADLLIRSRLIDKREIGCTLFLVEFQINNLGDKVTIKVMEFLIEDNTPYKEAIFVINWEVQKWLKAYISDPEESSSSNSPEPDMTMFNIYKGLSDEVIRLFGDNAQNQLDILQEGCAELIQAISKYRRGKPNAREKIIEEMAHVVISSSVCAELLHITKDDILKEQRKKAAAYGIDFNMEG